MIDDNDAFSLFSEPADDPKAIKARIAAGKRMARKAAATKVVRVLNLGAGVQSTAVLLMDAMVHRWGRRVEVEAWLERDYPFAQLDYAVFADTQDEPRAVYEHLARLKAMDTALILEGSVGRLGDDLIAGILSSNSRFASIPAFTSDTEGQHQGITRRQSTREYKIDVVERIIRRDIFGLDAGKTIPVNSKVIQSFGLSWDEPNRIAKVKLRVEAKGWTEPLFPLAELEMERADCSAWLATIEIEAPRSACVFCPYRKNAEWRRLRDTDPEGWDRAIEIDEGMRRAEESKACGFRKRLYLHTSCLPLAIAPIDEPDLSLGFMAECEGMCGA